MKKYSRKKITDRGFMLSLLALSGFFVTITIPIIFSKDWLTICWALQAVLFLWVGCKLKSRFIIHTSYLVYLLVIWRFVCLDLGRQFGNIDGLNTFTDYAKILFRHLLQFGIPVLSFAGGWKILEKNKRPQASQISSENDISTILNNNFASSAIFWIAIVSTFLYLQFELNCMFGVLCEVLRMPILTFLWLCLAGLISRMFTDSKSKILLKFLIILAFAILLKLTVFDLIYWKFNITSFTYEVGKYSFFATFTRFIDFFLVCVFFAWLSRKLFLKKDEKAYSVYFAIISIILLFCFLSFETNTFTREFMRGFQYGALSLLWSLFAFSFLLGRILKDIKKLRYAGLALFSITVCKIFIFDLANLDPLYRIVAFILLGIIILSSAFLYLKHQEQFNRK